MIRPDRTLTVAKSAIGDYHVIRRYGDQSPLIIHFDTTHDVAAAALLCDAVVITDNLDIRHACRAIHVRVLWPEDIADSR